MVLCLQVTSKYNIYQIDIDQSQISNQLNGQITFIGVLPQHNAFIVCRKSPINNEKYWTNHHFFENSKVYGDIIIFASDDEGEQIDLDVDSLKNIIYLWSTEQSSQFSTS